MTKKEAEGIVERVARGEIALHFSDHFWERANERLPGLTRSHIYYLLHEGKVIGRPRVCPNFGNYSVQVRATLLDYDIVQAVVGISAHDDAVCITVYEIEEED